MSFILHCQLGDNTDPDCTVVGKNVEINRARIVNDDDDIKT
jgi:hypothetical protein